MMVESDSCTRLSSDSEGDEEGGSASSINADEILSASKMSGAASVDGVSILLTQQPSSEYNGGQNEIDASRTQVLQTSSIEAIPDGTAPVPFSNLEQQHDCDKPAADRKSDATNEQNSSIEAIPDGTGPVPFTNLTEVETKFDKEIKAKRAKYEHALAKKKAPMQATERSTADDKSDIRNTDELEDDSISQANQIQAEPELLDDETTIGPVPHAVPLQNNFSVDIEVPRGTGVSSLRNTTVSPSTFIDHTASVTVIPEAYLVESQLCDSDQEVAVAEMVRPWWKLKRTYALLSVIILLIIVISLAVGPWSNRSAAVIISANATTAAPSVSLAPSSSQRPSSQPSSCIGKESVAPKGIVFPFFNLTRAKCEIDGGHAVVVDIHEEEGLSIMYVVFYTLSKYGDWEKVYTTVEWVSFGNDTDLDFSFGYGDTNYDEEYSVAMDGNIVLIGVPFMNNGTGSVFAYEYFDRISEWSPVLFQPFETVPLSDVNSTQSRRFGQSLDVNGDLAVVYAPGDDEVSVFLRDPRGLSWDQATTFDVPPNTTHVALSGSTIAASADAIHLFEYNQTLNSVENSQNLLFEYEDDIESLVLSEHHLAVAVFDGQYAYDSYDNGCWNPYHRQAFLIPVYDILLYNRLDAAHPFSFVQKLNSTDFGLGLASNIAMDEDILLVGGAGNETNVFIYRDGYWEKELVVNTPNQCGLVGDMDRVYVSKRNAIVSTERDVYMYNIDECAPMPSSTPSSSPSHSPTVTCFWIEVSAEHYHANPPKWSVEHVKFTDSEPSESNVVPTQRPTFIGSTIYVGYDPYHLTYTSEEMCLKEGEYQLTIFNDPLSYNISSYGNIIAEGGNFGYKESTVFMIPFE